jgi:hypothetical protein
MAFWLTIQRSSANGDGNLSGCSGISQDQLNWHHKAGREFCPDARYGPKRIERVCTTDISLTS